MIMRAQRLRCMIIAVVFLAIVWLGYWIGYVSRMPQPGQDKLDNNNLESNALRKNDIVADNIVVVDSNANKNTQPNNDIQGFDAQNHVLGIHKGHAKHISDLLNARTEKERGKPSKVNINSKDSDPGDMPDLNFAEKGYETSKTHRDEEQEDKDETFDNFLGFDHVNKPLEKSSINSERKKPEPLLPFGEQPHHEHDHVHREPQEGDVHLPEVQKIKLNQNFVNAHAQKQATPSDSYYVLLHAGQASKVHGQIHAKLRSLPKSVPKEAYLLSSKSFPSEVTSRPSIGNGYLGTMIHAKEVYMQGLYSGRLQESHRAVIPSTCSLNITHTDPPTRFTRTYRLNVGEGIYSELSESRYYNLTHRIFAHRKIKHLLVVEIDLERTDISSPLKLKIQLNRWTSSHDITFRQGDSLMEEVSYKYGSINAPESDDATYDEVHLLYDHVPDELEVPSGNYRTKWVFLSSIASNRQEAVDAYREGVRLIHGNDELYGSHVKTWSDLWAKGRVDILGQLGIAQMAYSSWYYLLSSMPLEKDFSVPFTGLSPSGLPLGKMGEGFQGRVLWDQEVWMYPNFLLLHQDMGKTILDSRLYTHKSAKINAGKDIGARFATESGASGIELSSKSDSAKSYHVTGMVSYAILQYLYASNDTSILEREHYVDILSDVAHFWVSKLDHDTQGKYVLKGVNPPDISHPGVNNPAFSTALAQLCMAAPEYAFNLINKTIGSRWKEFIDNTDVLFDDGARYHPAYDGFSPGTKVHQVDTVLLRYPLLRSMPDEVRENDLRIYEKNTNPNTPPTSWSMYAIGWLESGKIAAAESSFTKHKAYIKNEFKVWSDRTLGGATNYLSGMGGFLQSVINGYGGFRIRHDRLDFNPTLIPDSTGMDFIGVDYMGASIDFYVRTDEIIVTTVSQNEGATPLKVYMYNPEEVYDLIINQTVRLKPRKGAIMTANRRYPKEI